MYPLFLKSIVLNINVNLLQSLQVLIQGQIALIDQS